MNLIQLDERRLTRSVVSAASLSWLVVLACIIGSQSVFAQTSDGLKSAQDLLASAQLPVPKANLQAGSCPECPAVGDCTDCPECQPGKIPPAVVRLNGFVMEPSNQMPNCDCPECVRSASPKPDPALSKALRRLPLTTTGFVENYGIPYNETPTPGDIGQQFARLLSNCLKNLEPDDPDFNATIELGMKMMAQQAWSEYQNKLTQAQASYEKEIASLRGQLQQVQNQANVARVVNDWLGSLFANQNRNYQQMKELAASIESRMQAPQTANRVEAPKMLAPVRQANLVEKEQDAEFRHLQEQLRRIESRLQQLRSQSPVRPAGYLEPVYDNKHRLTPVPAAMSIPRTTSFSDQPAHWNRNPPSHGN